jgi:hypothetical protein
MTGAVYKACLEKDGLLSFPQGLYALRVISLRRSVVSI